MLCLGARKKTNSSKQSLYSNNQTFASDEINTIPIAHIMQECEELKSKNLDNLNIIVQQNSKIKELKEALEKYTDNQENYNANDIVSNLEIGEKDVQSNEFQEKENLIMILLEKEKLLQDKENEIEELKSQWEIEKAELVKPALQQVNTQIEELKEANQIISERLTEKENELAELRSELNRKDRKPKTASNVMEHHNRLNRLTLDLENDRLLMQRLEDLNQQLESQKKKHEAILESHAKEIEEKNKVLIQHQRSLRQLKLSHENATKNLEQKQMHDMSKTQLQHQKEISDLTKRLKQAENVAKDNVNDELDNILKEFEQSQHSHSVQIANLENSYQKQMALMKQDQQTEIENLLHKTKRMPIKNEITFNSNNLNKNNINGNGISKLKDNAKFTWPPTA